MRNTSLPASPVAVPVAVAALGCLLVVALIVGWPEPAGAHTEVLRASPGPAEEVSGPVEAVELTFLDPVSEVSIEVLDSLGDTITGLGETVVGDERRRAEVSFPALTDAGDYVVAYTFTAADGDTQRETYRFTIGATDGDGPSAAGTVAIAAAVAVVLLGAGVSLRRRGGIRAPASRRGQTAGPDNETLPGGTTDEQERAHREGRQAVRRGQEDRG